MNPSRLNPRVDSASAYVFQKDEGRATFRKTVEYIEYSLGKMEVRKLRWLN